MLYQFPLSLYCEKTRWHLEMKGIDFTCRNMIPGLHAVPAWLMAQQTSLPIFSDDKVTIGDSTKIALYLEKNYTQFPLLPSDEAQRKQILEREDWFDELGDHVRRVCWSKFISSSNIVDIFFNFEGYSPFQQFLTKYNQGILRLMLRHTLKIYPEQVEISQQWLNDSLIQIEKWLDGNPDNYLVGNTFTLADLTAASMLAPLIEPDNTHGQTVIYHMKQNKYVKKSEIVLQLNGYYAYTTNIAKLNHFINFMLKRKIKCQN